MMQMYGSCYSVCSKVSKTETPKLLFSRMPLKIFSGFGKTPAATFIP